MTMYSRRKASIKKSRHCSLVSYFRWFNYTNLIFGIIRMRNTSLRQLSSSSIQVHFILWNSFNFSLMRKIIKLHVRKKAECDMMVW